jgi:predicted ATPase/DNA-binding CsgD family transcriptional regulator
MGSGNLPAEVTTFIGRSAELEQVNEALARSTLVTLRGLGGVGKTRLALRAAAHVSGSFTDGVWLVELSSLRNPELLARTVAAALGVPDQSSADPLDLVASYLADRQLLLILDTCEHLIDGCALLTEALLHASPRLHILATSREPLNVMGEQALLVPPLTLPPANAPGPEADSVLLFLDRALAMGFRLGEQDLEAVARLCRRLDGIPLALELAAVRLRSMPVGQLAARADDRFGSLGSFRGPIGRHQTLRAAIDWSYDLCSPAEQRLWARLSVFPGDFGLDAAERICGEDAEVLTRLVEKSVVGYEHETGRYRLLDTIREYGAERLGPGPQELPRRHRDYYLTLAESAAAGGFGADQVHWLTRLRQETHNLRVALDYSYATPAENGKGLRMTVLLRPYWLMCGLFAEGRRWHDLALALGQDDTPDGAWAVYGAGVLAVQQGDFDYANPLLDRARELAARQGDRDLAAQVTMARGMSLFHSGDVDGGRALLETAVGEFADIGYREPFALSVLTRIAVACFLEGEFDRAISLSAEVMRLADELGDSWNLGIALWVRGATRWLAGQTDLAIEDTLAALDLKESLGDLHSITQCIDLLAVCLATKGEFTRAARLCGAGDALWEMMRTPNQAGPHYAQARQGGADACRQALGDERFESLRQHGLTWTVAEAIAFAKGRKDHDKPLTKRELEIAGLVAEGLSNREMAERLVLSKRTIDAHIEHILAKLGFSSRTQIAEWVQTSATTSS